MKLSRTVGHALAAVICVAQSSPESLQNNRDICERVGLPRPFMLKLLGILTEKNILSSTRGRYGGYQMARPPEEITLLEIIEAIEGPIGHPVELNAIGLIPEMFTLIEDTLAAATADARARLAGITLSGLIAK